jgi:hypothetical protein
MTFTYTNWNSPSQRRRERERQVRLAELRAEKSRRQRQIGETSAAYVLRSARESKRRFNKSGDLVWSLAVAEDVLEMRTMGLAFQEMSDRLSVSPNRLKQLWKKVSSRYLFVCETCGGTGDGSGGDEFNSGFPPPCRDCDGTGRVGYWTGPPIRRSSEEVRALNELCAFVDAADAK